MFKKNVPIPAGVEVERYYDVQEIGNGQKTVSFFTANPNGVETDNNYSKNPFADDVNHLILGISLDPLVKLLRTGAGIDPAYVINNLSDGTLKLSTNNKRSTDILHPIKDYFNFTGMQISGQVDHGGASNILTATLNSTGFRAPDNLFFLKRNENFGLEAEFNSGVWPTAQNWTDLGVGRFGIKAELYVAKMTDQQLNDYQKRYAATI
ncbi:MAG: hypothetical protein AAFW89_13005 [Bacteroidota bacterium]